jgi:methyltransferase OMS1
MGIPILRKRLISYAKGNTLEVGCGTGRNIAYYDFKKVTSLNLADGSPKMLKIAGNKARDIPPPQPDLILTESDTSNLQSIPDGTFDTVVSTFTLCSYSDPESALREMQRVCDPENGQILLLEHGLGKYGWLNNVLSAGAKKHFEKWGCQWDRDIEDLIADSGMNMEGGIVWKWHFGTTYYARLKPGDTWRKARNPSKVKFGTF